MSGERAHHGELARLQARVEALEARAAAAQALGDQYAAEVARVREDTLTRVPASMRPQVALMVELQSIAAEGGLTDDEARRLDEVRAALGVGDAA